MVAETIAIIKSDKFDFGLADLYDPEAPPGYAFVSYLIESLQRKGGKLVCEPVAGEEGWTFDLTTGGKDYRAFVHWAPIGNPPSNRWVVQPRIRRTLLGTIFGTKSQSSDLAPIVDLLHESLADLAVIESVRWISDSEFASIY